MFSLLSLSGTLAAWKHRYCNGQYTTCERYRLSAAGRSVPQNLMPNGVLLKKLAAPAK